MGSVRRVHSKELLANVNYRRALPYFRLQEPVLDKGEFELSLLRHRSQEAIRLKALRGELRILLPVGFHWTSSGKIEKHPDHRVQQAIELVFRKMTELGSARRVLHWFA